MAVWTLAVLLAVLQVTSGDVGCPTMVCTQTCQTAAASPRVAFTLTRSTDLGVVSSTADLAVTFDHVLTDVGGSFTDVTNPSVFNCQHPGVYQFSFSALSLTDRSAFVKLMKNGQFQLAMWAGHSSNYGSGANTAVLELEQGDRVWLAIGEPNRYAIHSNTNRFISFTGVLLYST
ncbi:complement C1q tumor necrosis factor-related protein 4-like [Branchiostoma floridae x Branchiostoma japonicum]